MTFFTNLGVSVSPHNVTVTVPEEITISDNLLNEKMDVMPFTEGSDSTSFSSVAATGDVGSSVSHLDAGGLFSSAAETVVTALTSKITLTLWWVNLDYTIPEIPGKTMTTRVRFVDYYPCSTGKNLTQGMVAGIIISLALTLCNTLVSAAQLCMKKTSILRTTINVFVAFAFVISLVPVAMLIVMYLSSICGLESLRDAGAAPRLGAAGIVIGAGLNLLSLAFCFFL